MTRLIGYRWKYSDVWSRVVLIARSLPQFFFIICLPQKVQSECFFLPTLSKKYSLFSNGKKTIKVVGGYSEGVHLFPFRTEKLSSSALMVLPYGGRVSRRQPKLKRSCINLQGLFFCHKRTPHRGDDNNNLTPKGSHVYDYLVTDGQMLYSYIMPLAAIMFY